MFLGYEVTDVADGPDKAQLSAKNPATGEVERFFAHYLVEADGGNSLTRRRIADRQWI